MEENKEIESCVNNNINLCPECQKPMNKINKKFKCFKCGIEVELKNA